LRIMWLGDSKVQEGTVAPGSFRRATAYDRLVAAGWEFDFVGRQQAGGFPDPDHEGWGGFTLAQLNASIIGPALAANPADLIYIDAGTNDAIHLTDGQTAISALLQTIATASYQTRILVTTEPPLDPASPSVTGGAASAAAITAYNAALPGIVAAQVALGQHVHLADAGGSLVLSDLQSDGIHPTNPTGYTKLGNLDADAILALYTVTAPTLPDRVAISVGLAGVDTYRVTIDPIGDNAVKAVKFGARVNIESILSLQLSFVTYASGSLSFTVQRSLPLDASLDLTITDSSGDWDTQIAMAAGPA
jgi:lysophospholipase L1-like esterase